MATTSALSWMEQMQQIKRQTAQEGDADAESKLEPRKQETPGQVLHWLLKASMPEWTNKELKSTKTKLKSVGIECCSDLEDSLQEKGELNHRLREKSMKTFGAPTLGRFRSQIKTHRERQRMQVLVEERRRLDLERKANMDHMDIPASFPASSTQSTADGQEETDSLSDPPTTPSGSTGVPAQCNAEEEVDAASGDSGAVDSCDAEEEGPCAADASRHSSENSGSDSENAVSDEDDSETTNAEVEASSASMDQQDTVSPESRSPSASTKEGSASTSANDAPREEAEESDLNLEADLLDLPDAAAGADISEEEEAAADLDLEEAEGATVDAEAEVEVEADDLEEEAEEGSAKEDEEEF